jgi:hypothetical protein
MSSLYWFPLTYTIETYIVSKADKKMCWFTSLRTFFSGERGDEHTQNVLSNDVYLHTIKIGYPKEIWICTLNASFLPYDLTVLLQCDLCRFTAQLRSQITPLATIFFGPRRPFKLTVQHCVTVHFFFPTLTWYCANFRIIYLCTYDYIGKASFGSIIWKSHGVNKPNVSRSN